MKQAFQDQAADQPLDQSKVNRRFAQHAYEWTTDMNKNPTQTTGDALQVSQGMLDKYKDWFLPRIIAHTLGTKHDVATSYD